MLESTFLEDWDENGAKMAKKGHLLPNGSINSELVSIQRVNHIFQVQAWRLCYSVTVLRLEDALFAKTEISFLKLSFL